MGRVTVIAAGLVVLVTARDNHHLAEDYLAKFGYLKTSSSGKTAALRSIDSAVKEFQAFAGLRQTGELDEETVKMMEMPRCGVKDVLEEEDSLSRQDWPSCPYHPNDLFSLFSLLLLELPYFGLFVVFLVH